MENKTPLPDLQQTLSDKLDAPRREVLAFYLAHPEFCDCLEHWEILVRYLPPEFDRELRWPDAEQLKAAYALAKQDGHFRVH